MEDSDRSSEESADACQQRCSQTTNCKHFTFWSDGGCHLQDAKAVRGDADNDITSGPDSCDYDWKQQDGYLPHGHNVFTGHYTSDQAKMKCLNILDCKGISYEGSPDENTAVRVYFKSVDAVDADSAGKGWTTWLNKGPATEEEENATHGIVQDFSAISGALTFGPGYSSTLSAGIGGIGALAVAGVIVGALRRRHRAGFQEVWPMLSDEVPNEVSLE